MIARAWIRACLWIGMIVFLTGCGVSMMTVADSSHNHRERNVVFEAYGVSFMNPYEPQRIASGELLKAASDGSNMFLESTDGQLIAVFNREQSRSLKESATKAITPRPINQGRDIVYASNKAMDPVSQELFSLYVFNLDKKQEFLLLDGAKFGSLYIVDAFDHKIYAAGESYSLIVIDLDTFETKKYKFNGQVDAISTDGNYVLYRKVSDGLILPEIWMLDLITAQSKYIGDQPANYFFK